MAISGAFDAIGLAAEYTPAAATYVIFQWLDKNLSDPARHAFAQWISGQPLHDLQMRPAILFLFDRIYGHPLLRFKSFKRSSLISFCVFSLSYLYYYVRYDPLHDFFFTNDLIIEIGFISLYLGVFLIVNILSDYMSLFLVRYYIQLTGRRLILTLCGASIVGILVIVSMFLVGFCALTVAAPVIDLIRFGNLGNSFDGIEQILGIFDLDFISSVIVSPVIIPSLMIHLWFPLLAIGSIGLRFIRAILYTVGKAQWLLRGGHDHPIRAAGLVAAAVTFTSTGIYHLGKWWMG